VTLLYHTDGYIYRNPLQFLAYLLFFFLFWQKRKKQRKLPFSQRQTRGVSEAATTLNRSLQFRIPSG
jgi:hypothetical protein